MRPGTFGLPLHARETAVLPAAPRRSPLEPIAGDRVGGYLLVRELGRGGMGVVWEAHAEALDRRVALKLLTPAAGAVPALVDRFQLEARVAARLRHPNIVVIHEVGEDQGVPFIVMDLVEGESLARVLERHGGPLQPREAARIGLQLAQALAFAHARAILHRDLKPANVIVREDGSAVLTDFGLARDLSRGEDSPTRAGDVLGTPAYMPPEQAQGRLELIDRRADVYSLGATLYELVTGQPPFVGASGAEVLGRVLRDEPLPPVRLRPGLERDLETIVVRCLEKEPERRYPGAQELADDLLRFLEHRSILARRARPAERARKWVRRNRATTDALLGAALVALALGIAGTAAFVRRLHTERDRADAARADAEVQRAAVEAALAAARVASARAEAEARRAREQADLARDVLHVLVSEVRLALGSEADEGIRLARRKLLSHAQGGFARLAATLGRDADPADVLEIQRELAHLDHEEGRFEEASRAFRIAIEAARRSGRPAIDPLLGLGDSEHALGRASRAEAAWRAALLEPGPDPTCPAHRSRLHLRLAQVRLGRGDPDGAAVELAASRREPMVDHGRHRVEVDLLECQVALARGDVAGAGSTASAALGRARELLASVPDDRPMQAMAARCLAHVARARSAEGDPTGALSLLEPTLDPLRALHAGNPADRPGQSLLLEQLLLVAAIEADARRLEDARAHLDEALAMVGRPPLGHGPHGELARGEVLSQLGELELRAGQLAPAARRLEEALGIFRPRVNGEDGLRARRGLALALSRQAAVERRTGD